MYGETRTEGALRGMLKRANKTPGAVILVEDGEAALWLNERSGDRPVVDPALGPIAVDVRPFLDEGVVDPDPVCVVVRTYWTHVGTYGPGDEYPSFEAAVAAARASIRRIEYPGVPAQEGDTVEDGMVVTYTHAAVALRQESRYAPYNGVSSGVDSEIVRWEVYGDRVALVPRFQGGLTVDQEAAVKGLEPRGAPFA